MLRYAARVRPTSLRVCVQRPAATFSEPSRQCLLPQSANSAPLRKGYCGVSAVNASRAFSATAVARARGGRPGSEVQETYQRYDEPVAQQGGSEYDALTPEVRSYMIKVYNTMGSGMLTAGAGTAAMFMTPLGAAVGPAIGIAALVPILWLSFKPPATFGGRLALFHASTGLVGAGIAPVVAKAAMGGVLGSSLILTGAVFGGFSAAALLAPRGAALKMQGPLIAALIGLVCLSLLNLFIPMPFMHNLMMFGGLAIFSLLISADTGAMIERARQGHQDPIQDGLSMFLNIVNVFTRMVWVLGAMGE